MPAPDEKVWVVSPDGKVGTVPYAELQGAQGQGFRVASNADVAAHEEAKAKRKAATEGVLNRANAVVEGAARALTLGGADYLAAKLTPEVVEDVAARKETTLGQASELATTAAAILATGGGAGAARGAAATAAKTVGKEAGAAATEALLSKAGQQVAKAALKTPLGASLKAGRSAGLGAERVIANALGEGAATVGKGAEKLIGKALGGSEQATGAGRIGRFATEGAVDAGVQQVAHNISEASLGKEELTAERLMQGLGPSVLLGSGLGGGLAATGLLAKHAVKGTISKTRELTNRAMDNPLVSGAVSLLPNNVSKAVDSASILGSISDASSKILSKEAEVTRRAFRDRNLRQDYLRRDDVLQEISDDLAPRLNRAAKLQQVRREATERAADIEQIASQVARGPDVLAAANLELAGLSAELQRATAIGMRPATRATLKRAIGDIATAAKAADEADLFVTLDRARTGFVKAAQREGKDVAEANGRLATRIDQILGNDGIWGAAGGMHRAARAAADEAAAGQFVARITDGGRINGKKLKKLIADTVEDDELQTVVRRELEAEENALLELTTNGPMGGRADATEALAEIREIKAAFSTGTKRASELNTLDRMVQQEGAGLMQPAMAAALGGMAGGPIGAAASLAVSALANPATLATKIGTIENMWQGVRVITDTTSALADKIAKAGRMASDNAAPLLASAGVAYSNAERRKEVERKQDILERAIENPELITAQVGRMTAGMDEAAPGVTTAIAAKYVKTVNYLRSKAPVVPAMGGIQGRLQPKAKIPDSAVVQMARRIDAATHPAEVFRQMARGEVYPDSIETLHAVWPEQMREVVGRVTQSLANDKIRSDYQHLLRLSAVTAAPLVATMTPEFISSQQGMFAEREQRRQEAASRPKLKTPDRATPAQNSSDAIVANLRGQQP